ncbi:MAG: GNAT family N-acetyltransferase [Microbacterium sp.]|uniref:GNAT family N-acetyltransferase n=1 Tax=Microbacterium sp. TaxID=51671 RepID=UPI001AC6503F|nr:GNAT family N-acetyltransferase [Microbacterium sp.]MBN9176713.1 GNAT family N-acetyltransferase [Microbacterium sp.]
MIEIRLRPWRDDDLPLLVAANAPEMTAHLGGPEAPDAVVARHEKYLRLVRDPAYGVQAIESGGVGVGVGGVNWWPSEWEGAPVTEMGWFVVPDAQGQGIAARAVALAIADARARAGHRTLVAFPAVDNLPSSRLCAASGFLRRGEAKLPYRDTVLRVGVWAQDLDG